MMTEQEARLIAKALAAELGKGQSRNENPRLSDRKSIDNEINKLNYEAKKINELSLSSSFKKYGAEVIGALKYGKDLHKVMQEFADDLKEISETSREESKKYSEELIKLIQSSKISAQEVLQLTTYLGDFEHAIRDGSKQSGEFAKEIIDITKRFAGLDSSVKSYIDEANKAAKEKDKIKRQEKLENISLTNTSSKIGATFSNHYHKQSSIIYKQLEALPAQLIGRLRKGIVAGGKVTFDAMQAQMKYNIPTSTFGANLGRLNLTEADVAQSMAENRFGYRVLSNNNSAVSGFSGLNSSLRNALLQYGPAGGIETLKALQQSQSNLSSFGVNYGSQSNIAEQLNMFKNLGRSVGLTDAGLQEFTTSLVNSGVIASLESEKKFKSSKEEEKYIAKEIKERATLARMLGMSTEQMATMQHQGISNSFMGLQEYIMNRYVKPHLMRAQASMVGMHMTNRQVHAIAMYNSGNAQQKLKYAPQAIEALSEYFKHVSTSKGISGHLLQSSVGMSSESVQAVNEMNKAIATLVSISDKNSKASSILGIKTGDTATQKRKRIEEYYATNLNTPGNKNFQYLQSLMSKGAGTSGKLPIQKTMDINAEKVDIIANSVSSLGKNPFGAAFGSILSTIGNVALNIWTLKRLGGLVKAAPDALDAAGDAAAGAGAGAAGAGLALAGGTALVGVGALRLGGHELNKRATNLTNNIKQINMNASLDRLISQKEALYKSMIKYQVTAASFTRTIGPGSMSPTPISLNHFAEDPAAGRKYAALSNEINKYKAIGNISKSDASRTFTLDGRTDTLGAYIEQLIKDPKINVKQMESILTKIEKNTSRTAKHTAEQTAVQKQKNLADQIKNNSPQEMFLKHQQRLVAGIQRGAVQSQYQ